MYTSRLVLATALLWATSLGAQTAVPPAVTPPAAQAPAPPIPAARWTLAQLHEFFDLADTDSDGRLSRAEAQRLAIVPRSFEDMDQNKDGVLDRREYEGGAAAK